MRVTYHEHGGTVWKPLALTAEPVYSEADPGGYYEATIYARIPRTLRPRLERAVVCIEGPGTWWFGVVDDVGDAIHAWGWQHFLDDPIREACVCESEIASWTARTVQHAKKDANIATAMNGSSINFCVGPDGGTIASGAWAGQMLRVPATTHVRIDFNAHKPNNAAANWRIRLRVGNDDPSGPVTERIFWATSGGTSGSPWVRDTGDAGTSWTGQSVTVAAADYGLAAIRWVAVEGTVVTGYDPGIDKTAGFSNLKVYGARNVANNAFVMPTPVSILTDSCDRLPANVLPAGTAARAFIANDTTDLGRAVFDHRSKASDKAAFVVNASSYRYGWWARIVGGDYIPVPVYEARETTASYRAMCGPGVVATLTPAPFSSKARITRTEYRNGDTGSTLWSDVTDADVTHAPVRLGIDRYDVLSVDTADATLAAAVAARHQADVNRDSAPGTVEITTAILENGRRVLPCQIEAGRLITLDNTDYGTVTGRIVKVDKVGISKAVITLAGAPLPPKRALDKYLQSV